MFNGRLRSAMASNSVSAVFRFTPVPQSDTATCEVLLSGTTKTGLEWQAQSLQKDHLPVLEALFADPVVMAHFGSGEPRPREDTQMRFDTWRRRFDDGMPHGGLAVSVRHPRSKRLVMVGHIIVGAGDPDPVHGTSEFASAFFPDTSNDCFQDVDRGLQLKNKGLKTSVLQAVLTQWLPEVRRIGLNLDETVPSHISSKFRVFGGQSGVLERLDATCSPVNVASWIVLHKNGFVPAVSEVCDPERTAVDFSGRGDIRSEEEATAELLKLYQQPGGLLAGRRYRLKRTDGSVATFCLSERFGCIKYHFEYYVKDEAGKS